jgi:hypothetical protein
MASAGNRERSSDVGDFDATHYRYGVAQERGRGSLKPPPAAWGSMNAATAVVPVTVGGHQAVVRAFAAASCKRSLASPR